MVETTVVGGFGGHDDVMGVRLAQAGVSDADETAPFGHLLDIVRTDVEHGLVQAADHLI